MISWEEIMAELGLGYYQFKGGSEVEGYWHPRLGLAGCWKTVIVARSLDNSNGPRGRRLLSLTTATGGCGKKVGSAAASGEQRERLHMRSVAEKNRD